MGLLASELVDLLDDLRNFGVRNLLRDLEFAPSLAATLTTLVDPLSLLCTLAALSDRDRDR